MMRNENQKMENLRLAGAIQGLEELLTKTIGQDELKRIFYEVYFQLSQYAINHPDEATFNTSTNLYYLWQMADVLQNTDLKEKGITESQKTQLNNIFYPIQIDNPETTVLEVSENRTTQLDELTFIEAQTLLDRLNKVNKLQELTIIPARTA